MHLGRRATSLAGVCFIDDERKLLSAMIITNLVKDEREFLHCGDNDLLACLKKTSKIACSFGMAND
jgi:hypothetical protein